jgi:hypothetical protein
MRAIFHVAGHIITCMNPEYVMNATVITTDLSPRGGY